MPGVSLVGRPRCGKKKAVKGGLFSSVKRAKLTATPEENRQLGWKSLRMIDSTGVESDTNGLLAALMSHPACAYLLLSLRDYRAEEKKDLTYTPISISLDMFRNVLDFVRTFTVFHVIEIFQTNREIFQIL